MSFRLTSPTFEQSEDEVIARCQEFLSRRGWWLRRNPVGRYWTHSGHPVDFGPPGIPDYTAIHATYPAFFVEFKRPRAHLRPGQVDKFREIQFGFGLHAVMVDSAEELVAFLSGHEARSARGP